jgi:hypothetical protein
MSATLASRTRQDSCRRPVKLIVAKQPFEPLVPNETTIAAMREARAGNLEGFDSVEALMADLHAKD